ADEVKRWLSGEPPRAWREPLIARAGRWVRRNRVLAASLSAAAVVALVLGSAGLVWHQQRQLREQAEQAARRHRATAQAEAALEQGAQQRRQFRWAEAGALLAQARRWAEEARDDDLDARLEQARADLELAEELDQVRQEAGLVVEGRWDPRRAVGKYPEVLSRHGLDVLAGDSDKLARAIRASAVRADIVAALDDWARWEPAPGRFRRVLEVAEAADQPEPWRRQVRAAVRRGDVGRLKQLAARVGAAEPTPGTVLLLATALEA